MMVARTILLLPVLLFAASCLLVQCRKDGPGSLRGEQQAHRELFGERISSRRRERGGFGGAFRQEKAEFVPMRKKIVLTPAPTPAPTTLEMPVVTVTSAPSMEDTMEYSATGAPTMADTDIDTALDTDSLTEDMSDTTAPSSGMVMDASTETEPLTSSPSNAPVLSVNTVNQASYGYDVAIKDPSLVATETEAPSSSPPSSTVVTEEETTEDRGLYVGCWTEDSLVTEWEAGVDYSISSCMAYCHDFEFTYAGMQYPYKCFCGTGYDESSEAPESECSLPCKKDGGMCGNLGKISVWKIPGGV